MGPVVFKHTEANEHAMGRLLACRPVWNAVARVGDVIGGDRLILHPGPPVVRSTDLPAPIRNSLALACVYEGWAADPEAARAMIDSGEVSIGAAQDHRVVVPLAGVASPSMAVHVVVDQNDESRAYYAVLNEGPQHALRGGTVDAEVLVHHAWLDGQFSEWLSGALDGQVEVLPLLREALRRGDDCHSRTVNGSQLLVQRLVRRSGAPGDVADFLTSARSFALNLWMAAAALMLDSAAGVPGATVVTRAGGNGERFGIQLSGQPGRWFSVPATPPVGAIASEHVGRRVLGAVGDSPVLDFLGLGGMALRHAPDVAQGLGEVVPPDALERPGRLLARRSEALGTEVGLIAAACRAADRGPLVLLTMIEASGVGGQVGNGVFEAPVTLFEDAINGS